MAGDGYVRIYRSLMSKGYYSDSEYVHLWVHLIMRANYSPREYMVNGKIEHLNPGQFITGRNILASETRIHRSKIERILKTFEIEHQIEQLKTNKFRIITILNWSTYQNSEHQIEHPVSTNKKEIKKEIKKKRKKKRKKERKKEKKKKIKKKRKNT